MDLTENINDASLARLQTYNAGLMNKCETIQDLIGEVFDMIVGQCLTRFENTFQVCIHEVEDNVHIFRGVRPEKDISDTDDVLVID